MSKKWGKTKTGWLLVCFGLPFFGAGIGVSLWSAGMWRLHFQSASWVETPATIESVDYEVHHSSSSSSGGSSTSYSVDCTYRYTVDGHTYRGTRVGLEGSTGSSDSYHRTRYDELKSHRDQNKPFPALVNPEDPGEALLFRDVTTTLWMMPIFGLLFGLAGLAVMTFGLTTLIQGSKQKALLARYPDRPWLANPRWRSDRIQGHPLRKIAGSFAMALFTTLFMSMFIIAIVAESHVPFAVIAIIGGFCLIPADQPETFNAEYPAIRWCLTASAKTPGIDFKAEFDLPVFDLA